jgi:endonuclease/exonuclease/phosphatase family metal-dependent hydrolase
MRLRVATFNIHHGEGLDGRIDLARSADVVARTQADVVALQELDRGLPRSGMVDQPGELATSLGMHVSFWPTIRRSEGEYGIALATRSAPDEVSYLSLPQVGDEERRGAIVAESAWCRIVATHLSTHRSARRLQLGTLHDLARGWRGPTVILGDLNTPAAGLRAFQADGWRATFGHRTLVRGIGRRQIDHVLVSPGVGIERAWTIRTQASDHAPLVADLELPRQKTRSSARPAVLPL